MSGVERQSTFLPTVKCSSCGEQVEISLMGEHICGKAAPEPAAADLSPPPPANFDQFMPYNKIVHEKIGRVPPPKVDISAANRTYYRAGQLTPVSNSSGSRSVSPKTPVGRTGAGSLGVGLGGRSDDYFAPKIAGEYDATPPQQPRRPGGYGGFSDGSSAGGDGLDVDPLYPAPNSPKRQQGPSLLQRMNSIAPGPFEMRRKQSAASAAASDDDRSEVSAPRNNSINNNRLTNNDRPGTSASMRSNVSGAAPPRAPRKDGYGGFGPPSLRGDDDFEPPPFGAPGRAGTFPRPSEGTPEAPMRTPSAPGPRPERLRRPSNVSNASGEPMPRMQAANAERQRRPSMGPDSSRVPPPRAASIIRPRTSGRDGSVPSINLAEEFGIGNPYHTPSDSLSSSVSTFSRPSQPSSASSPSRSAGRKPSNTSNLSNLSSFDNLMSDLQSSMSDVDSARGMPSPALPPQQQQQQQQQQLSSSFDRARGPPPPLSEPRYDPAVQDPQRSKSRSRSRSRPRSPLVSPTWGAAPAPTPGRDEENNNRGGLQSGYGNNGGRRNLSPQTPLSSTSSNFRSSPEQRRPSSSRGGSSGQTSRGTCKACGDPISGKSVSSADGRLTGRYHKACFVCATCSEPFSSSTFYVHADRPYCERHYHEANGSLCGRCDSGIEGQYLADERDRKYHPACFVCADCRAPLREGYFEVGGRAYCERDAWKRIVREQQMQMQQQQQMQGPPPSQQQGGMLAAPGGPMKGIMPPFAGGPGGPRKSGSNLGPGGPGGMMPRGLPSGPGAGRMGMGGPPGSAGLPPRPFFGGPGGNRLGPGMGPGMGPGGGPRMPMPMPRMEKRMTRLGMM